MIEKIYSNNRDSYFLDKVQLKGIDGIDDEYVSRSIIEHSVDAKKAEAFADGIRNSISKIEKLELEIESYYRSMFSYINKANEVFKLTAMYDAIVKFEKEGIESISFYVEELRRMLFDDAHCEKLRGYNCIALSHGNYCNSGSESVCYHFSNDKIHFIVKIPFRCDIDSLLARLYSKNGIYSNMFDYGKIELTLKIDGNDHTIFQTYDILEFRNKLVECANSGFEKEIQKINSRFSTFKKEVVRNEK